MCNVYGYARISRAKQSIERQVRNIKAEFPKAVVFEEAFTGTQISRPVWNKLLTMVSDGDTIVFDSVSRMSRNADDGFQMYEELYNKGVRLVFIKEPHINTETYKMALESGVSMTGGAVDYILDGVNKYLMALAKEQIRLAFAQAEKEVEDLHQRTKEGIETARLNGKQIGRANGVKIETKKAKSAKEQILKYNVDFGGALNDVDTMKLIGLARNTFYKYKKELKVGN